MSTEKRNRPSELPGVTQRINTGYGKSYVRINVDLDPEGGPYTHEEVMAADPFEVFVDIGNSGGFTNGFCEAIAKLISNDIRRSSEPREVARESALDLAGIRSDKVGADNGDDIYSIPDAVAIAVIRFLEDRMSQQVRDDDTGKILHKYRNQNNDS